MEFLFGMLWGYFGEAVEIWLLHLLLAICFLVSAGSCENPQTRQGRGKRKSAVSRLSSTLARDPKNIFVLLNLQGFQYQIVDVIRMNVIYAFLLFFIGTRYTLNLAIVDIRSHIFACFNRPPTLFRIFGFLRWMIIC